MFYVRPVLECKKQMLYFHVCCFRCIFMYVALDFPTFSLLQLCPDIF